MKQAINKENNPAYSKDTTKQVKEKAEGNNITMKDILYLCLGHWRWFVFSIFVCLAVAVAHLLVTPKTYTRNMSILIKQDKDGKSITSEASQMFSEMGISSANTNVYNELLAIKANDVAEAVVKRINLNVNYTIDGRFHAETLYGETLPIHVDFPGMSDDDFVAFDVTIDNANSYTISNIKHDEDELENVLKGNFGYNMVNSPVGRLVLVKTRYFSNDFIGQTIHVTRCSIHDAVTSVTKRFEAQLSDKQATVIDMTMTDLVPQRAVDILNTIVTIYNENWVKDKNQIAVSTSQFITERLSVIEQELGNVDQNISSYKSQNGITDVAANSAVYLQQSTKAEDAALKLNNEIYMAKYIRSYLSKTSNNYQLLPANTGIEDQSVNTQINSYNNMILQRNNLVANSSENNPLVKDYDKQIIALRQSICQAIDNTLRTLEQQLNSQESFLGQADTNIAKNPEQAKHLLSDERQQKVKESLYLFLLQKREENELSQAFTAYNTRVVNSPNGPLTPTAPVTRNILLIALVLGFGIPFGILYLREMQNTKVRGKADLDGKITIPYLGEVPTYLNNIKRKRWEFWKKERKHKNLVVKFGSRGILNEAFRIVATNLEFMQGDSKDSGNVYMTTSYNQGSGKSFTTGNLGATLAIKKKRVLLIDGDLRHTSLSQFIESGKPTVGIANFLNGNVDDLQSIIHHSKRFEYLDIIPVGTIPPNPSELLASKRFEDMINTLRKEYDFIFIDCPPADMMADATIVSRVVDRTLFVIRANLFERSMLSQLQEDYETNKLKNMAIILNGTYGVGGRYGYGYGYKYGYGYGYGYKYGYGYGYGYGDQKEKE